MSARRSALLALGLAAAFALALSAADDSDSSRVVVPAMEADDAAALSAQAGIKPADFWERVRAMGVSAVVLRPQSLDEAVRRGEILRFDRAEVERWKAAGLLSPSSTLKPDTFWTRDERLFEQLLQAVISRGVSPTTGTLAGFHLIQIPEGSELPSLRGYDPARVTAAEGLTPVYAETGVPLGAVGFKRREGRLLGETRQPGETYDLALEAASWRAGSSRGALLRAALGRPRRLLVVRLDAGKPLEANLDAARAALRDLAARGAPVGSAERAQAKAESSPWKGPLARAAVWLLGILGPLFAARGGLVVLRKLREEVARRWPVASPVAQLSGGLASTTLFAVAVGLVAHACAGAAGAPLSQRWTFVSLAAPLAIALLTLYTIDFDEWRKHLAKPATYGALLALALVALAALLLLQPRWLLHRAHLWPALRAVGARLPGVWWWPWRWREMLVGVPCLMQAMFLINWRLECPDCASLPAAPVNDPRGWFLLGLLAPIGVVVALGQGAQPVGLALVHTACSLLLGALLGAGGVALRLRAAHAEHGEGPKGPHHK